MRDKTIELPTPIRVTAKLNNREHSIDFQNDVEGVFAGLPVAFMGTPRGSEFWLRWLRAQPWHSKELEHQALGLAADALANAARERARKQSRK